MGSLNSDVSAFHFPLIDIALRPTCEWKCFFAKIFREFIHMDPWPWTLAEHPRGDSATLGLRAGDGKLTSDWITRLSWLGLDRLQSITNLIVNRHKSFESFCARCWCLLELEMIVYLLGNSWQNIAEKWVDMPSSWDAMCKYFSQEMDEVGGCFNVIFAVKLQTSWRQPMTVAGQLNYSASLSTWECRDIQEGLKDFPPSTQFPVKRLPNVNIILFIDCSMWSIIGIGSWFGECFGWRNSIFRQKD